MSNLILHARNELERAGLFDKSSDYGGALGDAIMEIMEKFSDQDFSGYAAGMATHIVGRLSQFKVITPLTGDDDEWVDHGDGVFQNKRCSSVFKEQGGAHDIDGKVFVYPDGCRCSRGGCHTPITFPYMPGDPEVINVDENGDPT